MDLPDVVIAEGGGNPHNSLSEPLVIGVNQARVDRPAADYKDAAKDGPGTADEFPAQTNQGNVNKNWTTDELA